MNDALMNEVFRLLLLRAVQELPGDLQSSVLSDSPNTNDIVSQLKAHNDTQHSKLSDSSGMLNDLARAVKSRRNPRYS